jgi:hypothetical protein
MATSYSHRAGDYLYDLTFQDSAPPFPTGGFGARVVNMVRLDAGVTLSINAGLPDKYGATRADAFDHAQAAVTAWVRRQGH